MRGEQVPLIDMTLCVKCGKCINACPRTAITIRKSGDDYSCKKCVKYCIMMENVTCKPENLCIEYEKCDSCGACVSACEYGAVKWVGCTGTENT